jgi:hypothetical protein
MTAEAGPLDDRHRTGLPQCYAALRLVRAWMAAHADELQACWERAIAHEPPGRIDPLP